MTRKTAIRICVFIIALYSINYFLCNTIPMEDELTPVKMQPGPQMVACRVKADIVIIGGAFFGGKSYCLVGEAGREVDHPRYRATIFRRTYPQIVGSGGLSDISMKFYPTIWKTI